MSDLNERLRAETVIKRETHPALMYEGKVGTPTEVLTTMRRNPDGAEAADLIERLVAALEPFARCEHGIELVGRARRLICEVKGIKPATEPCAKVEVQTHG